MLAQKLPVWRHSSARKEFLLSMARIDAAYRESASLIGSRLHHHYGWKQSGIQFSLMVGEEFKGEKRGGIQEKRLTTKKNFCPKI